MDRPGLHRPAGRRKNHQVAMMDDIYKNESGVIELRVSVAAMAAMVCRSKKSQILMSYLTPETTNLTVLYFLQIRGKPTSQEPHGEDSAKMTLPARATRRGSAFSPSTTPHAHSHVTPLSPLIEGNWWSGGQLATEVLWWRSLAHS